MSQEADPIRAQGSPSPADPPSRSRRPEATGDGMPPIGRSVPKVELSDMLARDVFEWIRSDCKTGPRRWGLWGDKFYRRSDLRMGKFGLKVFPDSDIRDRVEAHRDGFRTGGN